ncbi:TPR repeat-containing protein [Clostridium beijerinckii]|nr:tetratricopeptide repeat protein [Clostridium beijerinckii]SQB22155.1 TPR repeat-containing protein [Clostridium beijerinckii]
MIALINTNDLDGIYEQIKDIKQESITSDDQEVYKQAVDLIKNQGVSRFYENGLKSFNENKYSDAKAFLDKAYAYCEGNSLKEHILFYRASSSSKLSDNSAAIRQYEEYYSQYPNGVYVEESLYDLALLNSSINMDKSKQYASILINNYPDSMYANNNIKNILKE